MTQTPLTLRRWTRVEYERLVDLGAFQGDPVDYRESHPARPALVVEVANSSLDFDRQQKGSLYARAGVPDYWIVNLIDRVLEVYRDPGPEPSAPYGWRYRSVATLTPPSVIAPLGLPSARIAAAAMLA